MAHLLRARPRPHPPRPAFRRLAGKTQVFVFPDDHQRTRLTHALEVAQVATSVARALGLNVALTEAIALGHDCGHGPGGHASEDALRRTSPAASTTPSGAPTSRWPRSTCAPRRSTASATTRGAGPAPATPEGEVVSWADRIAYVCHDFEDAVAAGIVAATCSRRRRRSLRHDSVAAARHVHPGDGRRGGHRSRRHDRAGRRGPRRVPPLQLRPRLPAPGQPGPGDAVIDLLRALVEHYGDRPTCCRPTAGRRRQRRGRPGRGPYVAGMTDRFACRQASPCSGGTRPSSRRRHLTRSEAHRPTSRASPRRRRHRSRLRGRADRHQADNLGDRTPDLRTPPRPRHPARLRTQPVTPRSSALTAARLGTRRPARAETRRPAPTAAPPRRRRCRRPERHAPVGRVGLGATTGGRRRPCGPALAELHAAVDEREQRSSPPMPTFLPGWNFVPRWRTMIVPAWIFVPS